MGTSREGIYAVGDVAGKALLAYTAHHEGVTAARNILGEPAHMDYRFVPSIIFSDPEIGSVGPTEEQLKQAGKRYRAGRYHVRALARAQAGGEIAGLVKVMVGDDNAILAVHMASPLATELIHTAVIAMAAGMKADMLADVPFGHPTFAEAISLAAADALG
jgi:dihydrolipoamide dehydrogenase